MNLTTLILVSSETSLIDAVSEALASVAGCSLETYTSVPAALPHLNRDEVALVAVHLGAGDDEPAVVRLLHEIASIKRAVATIVLSDREHPEQMLRLLRLGVAECLSRPLDLGRLAFLIDTLTMRARYAAAPCPRRAHATTVRSVGESDPFLYLTPEMERIVDSVRTLAPQDTAILFTGETGTGKTRLARLVHELSQRRDAPFVVVNCGSLSSSLIESELFGHVKGAFTGAEHDRTGKFAEAATGTVFLDDVDTVPLEAQAKLLRAVDARTFEPVGSNRVIPIRCRFIAATNLSLEEEVKAGRFRTDLYYRINVVNLYLPPLRNRRAVIPVLAEKFLADFAARNQRNVQRLSVDALRALQAYNWPGNVRELRNVIESAASLCRSDQILTADLPDVIFAAKRATGRAGAPEESTTTLAATKLEAELVRILEALRKHGGNRLRAAMDLGISRSGLYKKLHKYAIM